MRVLPSVLLFCALFAGTRAILAADAPDVRVGDWVSYETKVESPAGEITTTVKETVKSKTESAFTKQIDTVMAGQKMSQEVSLPLNALSAEGQTPGFVKVSEGDEPVVAGGKTYACHWIQGRVAGGDAGTESKVWVCPSVPLGGLVKMETSGAVRSVRMLTGCGRGP